MAGDEIEKKTFPLIFSLNHCKVTPVWIVVVTQMTMDSSVDTTGLWSWLSSAVREQIDFGGTDVTQMGRLNAGSENEGPMKIQIDQRPTDRTRK